ncbi:MAG TPA: general stress protein CsbD [Burkholderiales bacterium]|jgi:uncharacterized protein YjbJ (UPF0337 family)|nr:general stress protein CsbD [Burkholderiales bacterium]
MEWDRIAGNWRHFKGNALRHWRRLSAGQLDAIAGRREQLALEIQQTYSLSVEQAEKQLAAWQQAQKERDFLS